MPALQTLRDGNLDEAFRELQQEVRRSPADAKLRVFLFQLLAVQGQWDRALTQLNTAAELDPSTLIMAQMYREALQCEVLRAEVFAGKQSPLIFGNPPEWIGWLIEALRLTATAEDDAGDTMRPSNCACGLSTRRRPRPVVSTGSASSGLPTRTPASDRSSRP